MSRPGRGVRGGSVRGGNVRHTARRRRPDRGSVTAELALGLPAVLLLLLTGLTAVGAVGAKLQCVDAARQAAMAASRGESGHEAGQRAAPAGAEVSVRGDGATVVARVRTPVPLLGARLPRWSVEASAVAAVEPGAAVPPP